METISANRTYRLDRNAFERVTKPRLYRRFAIFGALVVVMAGFTLAFLARSDASLLDTLPYSVPLIALVLGVSIAVNVRAQLGKQRVTWDSYELTMGPSLLLRQIATLPSIEILRTEATRIDHGEGNGITIATADPHRFIFVPEALIGFDEVKAGLADWRPIDRPQRRALPFAVARSGLMLAAFFAAMVMPNIRVAILATVAFFGLLAWSARDVAKTKVMNANAKRVSLGAFAWFSLGPIARLLAHFVAGIDPTWPPGG